ncbi:MAG: MFS transporter, partial [Verrucomicrobiota bacterium]
TPRPTTTPELSLWRGIRTAFDNRPFLIVSVLTVLFGPGIVMTEGLGLYVNIYHVNGGDALAASQIAGVQGTLLYGAKFVWVPLVTALATRWGKKPTLFLCFALTLVASLCKWFFYTPDHPWLQIVVALIQTPGMAGAWVLLGSMIADTVDWDEAQTGLQRAGLLLAIAQWMRKTGTTAAFFIGGQILLWSGYDAARGVAQSEQTLFWLRVLFPLVPTVCIVAAIVLLCAYPITENKALAIRRQLEARRAGR